MAKIRSKRTIKINRERLKMREELWPNSGDICWDRNEAKGFTTVPRVLSMTCSIFQELGLKGNPASVYLDLWCRSFDEQYVTVNSEEDAAFASGYRGKRATRTWRDHIAALEQRGFIKTAVRGNTQFGYILVINPYIALANLRENGEITDFSWNAIRQRCLEVGASSELDSALSAEEEDEEQE